MGFFRINYNKPGPGVQKDEPRKKGFKRFIEVFFRDFMDLVKLNLLFTICVIPTIGFFIFGLAGSFIAIVLSLLAAYPVGGAAVAYVFYITKMLRDDPSYVWYDFKRKFIENHKQASLVGILCTAFVYAQIYSLWGFLIVEGQGFDLIWFVVTLLATLLFWMIVPYVFMHFGYIDLKPLQILKNSILMSLGYIPRSFMGAITSSVIWVLAALYFPVSMLFVPLIALIGVSLSILLCLMWVWPPFESYFKIEETLMQRQEDKDSETE